MQSEIRIKLPKYIFFFLKLSQHSAKFKFNCLWVLKLKFEVRIKLNLDASILHISTFTLKRHNKKDCCLIVQNGKTKVCSSLTLLKKWIFTSVRKKESKDLNI